MTTITFPRYAKAWVVLRNYGFKEIFWTEEDANAFMADKDSKRDGWNIQLATVKLPPTDSFEMATDDYFSILNQTYAQGNHDQLTGVIEYLKKRIANQQALGIKNSQARDILADLERLRK